MKKLEKPKFFNQSSFMNIIGIISFAIQIAQLLIPDIFLQLKFKVYILLLNIILFLIIYTTQYIYNWLRFYKNYSAFYDDYVNLQKRHIELSKQFDKKSQIINDNERLIAEYKRNLIELAGNISSGKLPVTKYEKEYLKNLEESALTKITYLYNLEGGLENGRKNI